MCGKSRSTHHKLHLHTQHTQPTYSPSTVGVARSHLLHSAAAVGGRALARGLAAPDGSAYLVLRLMSHSVPRPNVLYILFDDLRADEFAFVQKSAMARRRHHTPTFDDLADTGAYFHLAFSQTAFCAPSRASFLTGMRPERNGYVHNEQAQRFGVARNLPLPVGTTIIDAFKSAGFSTAVVGKIFHFGEAHPAIEKPLVAGTHDLLAAPCSDNPAQAANVTQPSTNVSSLPRTRACRLPFGSFVDQRVAAHAVRLMHELARAPKPFLLLVGFQRPHVPYQFPSHHLNFLPLADETDVASVSYKPHSVPEIAYADNADFCNNIGCARETRRFYRGAVSHVDEMLGIVLRELPVLRIENTTLVVAHSDHGVALGENGAWHKRQNFDASSRVPLFVRVPWMPNVRGLRVTRALIELIDVFPTLLDLAGCPRWAVPTHLEGRSFRQLLHDGRRVPPSKGSADGFRFAFMLQPRLLYLPRRAANFTDIKTAIFDGHANASHFGMDPLDIDLRRRACSESLLRTGFGPGRNCRFVAMGFSVRSVEWRYTRWVQWSEKQGWSVGDGALLAEELYGYGHRVYNENGTNLADPLVFRQLADDRRMEVRRVMDEMMQALLSRHS